MTPRKHDICIVGSGITGSLAAEHFVSKGLNVLMLERGDTFYLPTTKEAYWREKWDVVSRKPLVSKNTWKGADKYFEDLVEIENAREEYAFYYNMRYGIGGSGVVWSAASWRFTPEDFKTRSLYDYGRDWAQSYDDLAPHYSTVEQKFGTSGPKGLPESLWPWKNDYAYPAFKQSYLDKVAAPLFAPEFILTPSPFSVTNKDPKEGGCVGAKSCVKHCPANAKYRPDMQILKRLLDKPNFELRAATPCLHLNSRDGTRIDSATVLDAGKESDVSASYFFLAANTIENIRLLLNSQDGHGRTLANSSGLLGAFFASHGTLVYSVIPEEPTYTARGRPTTSSAINKLNHSRRSELGSYMLEVWNRDPLVGTTPKAAFGTLRIRERHWGRTLFEQTRESGHRFKISFIYEMEMRERNRVTLSSVKDKHGLPLAKVDFLRNARDIATLDHLKQTADRIGKRKGFRLMLYRGEGLNGNHPMGGYVAGGDSSRSVVDRYCRAHDYPNLYVLGAGAFNSTSCLNPTHTISALALHSASDPRISI